MRWHLAALRFEVAMLRHGRELRRKFDPNQPRVPAGEPGGGRWTNEESNEVDLSAARRVSPARTAECEMQLRRDTFHCNMVGLRACYAQAMLRYANCLSGLPIPPLSY